MNLLIPKYGVPITVAILVLGAWVARVRWLARDFERLPEVLAGLRVLAFVCLMLHQLIELYASS